MRGLLRAIPSGVLAIAVAGAGFSNVLVAHAADEPPAITSMELTPTVVNEGDMVRVDVTFTDPGALTEAIAVFWGDGQTDQWTWSGGEQSFFAEHRYFDDPTTADDRFEVAVTIADGVNPAARASRPVTVHNVAPVITEFTVTPPTILQGQSAVVRGTFVDPSTGDTYALTIDWGDGTVPSATTVPSRSRTFSLTHSYLIGGRAFTITATLNDGDAGVGVATVPIVVTALNTPPSALAVVPGAAFEGGTTAFAVNFVDPDVADTHTASVDWGDGSALESIDIAAGVTSLGPTHVYRDSGSYNATFTVADSAARTLPLTVVVSVANVAPTVTAVAVIPSSIVEQESVTVEVTFTDPGASDTFRLTLNWGDGSSSSVDLAAGTHASSAAHQYLAAGTFAIVATVTDSDNAAGSSTKMLEVRSRNRAPSGLVLHATSPVEGSPATLTGSFSDPDASDTHTVSVTWGDGTTGTLPLDAGVVSFSATHTYATRGTYHVGVTVTDPAGLAASAALDLVVRTKSVKECDYLSALEQRLLQYSWEHDPELRDLLLRAIAILNAYFGCDDGLLTLREEIGGPGSYEIRSGRHRATMTRGQITAISNALERLGATGDRSRRADR